MLENGFPYECYPTGWFQVAWDGSLAVGEIRRLRYFGQELVLYRDAEGAVHVADAYCPHQGANLGVGGVVQGCDLVCPFHGWTWGPDGQNVSTADEGPPNRSRRLRMWPANVSNGVIWVWHDERGRAPLWEPAPEIPAMADPAYYPIYPHCVRQYRGIRVVPQWITENNADLAHLRTIHRAAGPIEQDFELLGPVLRSRTRMTFGYGKPSSRLTPEGPQEGALVAEHWGVGIIKILFAGIDEAWLLQAQTPVDHDHSDIFVTVVTARPEGAVADELVGTAKARFEEQCKQLERDFPIWENMRYVVNGPMTREEASHMAPLRRWARQFYPDAAEETSDSKLAV
jgi:phenylpropionate dioxygenase-like ring-hydroxylating dioxygenase large terminal subunit